MPTKRNKIENSIGLCCANRGAKIADAENRRKENESYAAREDFAEDYADKAVQVGMSTNLKEMARRKCYADDDGSEEMCYAKETARRECYADDDDSEEDVLLMTTVTARR